MTRFLLPLVLGLLLFLGVGRPSAADDGEAGIPMSDLFPGAVFDPEAPTPESVLGIVPGSRAVRHAEVLRYLETLAAWSPRARLEVFGRTHESRELLLLYVSDEDTVARLDEVRQEHAARMDPRRHPESEDGARVADAKAVAWMAYGIHGDELSSVDAALCVAYWLVAGEDDRAKRLREELVIVMEPAENPDGRERYLAQVQSFAHATPNPDSEDLSHRAIWPWGRGNHYLFDLNRDWFSLVHPESQHSRLIASWHPQLMVDSHEMGSQDTYLFSPPRHPFNPHLPESQQKWWDRFAADQARALDARGYAYYTRDWNEEFFPGYGSSWASYLGAVGILYEMSRTTGTLVRQYGGALRTFPEAVEHQVASSVANLETLAANRREVLEDFLRDRRAAVQQASEGAVGAWVLPEGRHPERTRRLVRLLGAQGIEVLRNAEPSPRVAGLRDARTGEAVDAGSLPEATWLVPLDQPLGRLGRVLLDPHVPMDATFLREEREYLERGKGSRLYEITAWSLPSSYAIDAYWTAERPREGWAPAEPPEAQGRLVEKDEAFGYLLDVTTDGAMGALADVFQRNLRVRVAEKPFRIEGHDYVRGSLLLRRDENPEDLAVHLREVAPRWNVEIRAVTTAKAEEGPDLGGR
ncbi:MAG: M14 family zinc carboxypeptidase, partial [Planctomycetota bacterium]